MTQFLRRFGLLLMVSALALSLLVVAGGASARSRTVSSNFCNQFPKLCKTVTRTTTVTASTTVTAPNTTITVTSNATTISTSTNVTTTFTSTNVVSTTTVTSATTVYCFPFDQFGQPNPTCFPFVF